MDDWARDLATQLHRRSEAVTPTEDLPARIHARVDRHHHRRRLLQSSVPALCLLIGAVTFVALVGPGRGTPSSRSAASSAGSSAGSSDSRAPSSAQPSQAAANGEARISAGSSMPGAPVFGQTQKTAGWIPVDYGNVQISVPPGAVIGSGPCPEPSVAVTVHLGRPPAGVFNCPLEQAGVTTVTLEPVPAGASTSGLASRHVHGVTVFLNFGSPAKDAELVPSLGAEVQASGSQASIILGTLTPSPRTVALAGGRAPRVPGSWRRVTFGGLSVAVPASWPVQNATVEGTPCELEPVWESHPVIGSDGRPAVILDAGQPAPPQKLCTAQNTSPIGYDQPVEQPTPGLVINSGSLVPPSGVTSYGRCLAIAGLRACPAHDPEQYGELVLQVQLASGKTDAVVIGMAGNGQTERTVLHSLRPG